MKVLSGAEWSVFWGEGERNESPLRRRMECFLGGGSGMGVLSGAEWNVHWGRGSGTEVLPGAEWSVLGGGGAE